MTAAAPKTLDDLVHQMTPALDWIDSQQEAMVEQVQAWSRINSGSHNLTGLKAMGEEIDTAFAELGGSRSLIEAEPGVRVADDGTVGPLDYGPMHRFTKRPDVTRRILFTGHLDTVFPIDHPFQEPRWLDDNTLNGPGVADMKGGLIVMLTALKAVEETPLAKGFGWDILVSSDEEIGSIGSGPILARLAQQAQIGMTYEPALADGTLAGARKGSGNFTFVVRGRAAHAGREFDAGRNAVMAISEIIGRLWALNGARKGLTVNPAKISGGVAPNIVPDAAVCRFNVRLEDPADGEWFRAQLEAIRKDWNGRDGFSCELYGEINRPPKPLSKANEALFEFVRACGKAVDLDIAWKPTGGCCEGNNLAAAGLPNVDTLGVRGGLIHSSDEFILVDSFSERAKLSALIMAGFSAGLFDPAEA